VGSIGTWYVVVSDGGWNFGCCTLSVGA
jgi:hypothetical protein